MQPLAELCFERHPDPLVRLNLAQGLVRHRRAATQTTKFLEQQLENQELLAQRDVCGITVWTRPRSLIGAETEKNGSLENLAHKVSLCNTLALLESSKTEMLATEFLNTREWQISFMASLLLLTEGSEQAIERVRSQSSHENQRIRLHAALLLALWDREGASIEALKQGYPESDRDGKLKILETLGKIGAVQSIPFLMHRLEEDSQTLRTIAAMAVLQCLQH